MRSESVEVNNMRTPKIKRWKSIKVVSFKVFGKKVNQAQRKFLSPLKPSCHNEFVNFVLYLTLYTSSCYHFSGGLFRVVEKAMYGYNKQQANTRKQKLQVTPLHRRQHSKQQISPDYDAALARTCCRKSSTKLAPVGDDGAGGLCVRFALACCSCASVLVVVAGLG